MAIHGFAFRGTADDAALTEIPPVQDETVFVVGNDLQVPEGHNQIVLAAALGATLSRAVLDSPEIRTISRHSITPLDVAAVPGDDLPINRLLDNPIPVKPGEALNALAQNTGGAASNKYVGVWLSDGSVQPTTGANVRSVRGTTDFDAVAGEWSNGQITLETDLPAGTYAVVGFRAEAANGIFARLIFPRQGYRPMVMCAQNAGTWPPAVFRPGTMGAMGTFQNLTAPRLELLADQAVSDPVCYLDVVRTSGA